MTDDPRPAPSSAVPAAPIVVTVVRSGGVAGLTRRWGVQAPPSDPARWSALVAACPWDDPPPSGDGRPGADRFSWTVEVSSAGARRRAALSESEAAGAWRALIDAVRAASDRTR